jgi:cell division protein FtsW (lipid II flippase)
MLDLVLMWVVLSAVAIGFILSMQAAGEAKRQGDLGRRLTFYGMAAMVALYVVSRTPPG